MRTDLAPGDWIRFLHCGCLVVDVVAYVVPRATWDSTPEAITVHHGQVPRDHVIEVRRLLNPEPRRENGP